MIPSREAHGPPKCFIPDPFLSPLSILSRVDLPAAPNAIHPLNESPEEGGAPARGALPLAPEPDTTVGRTASGNMRIRSFSLAGPPSAVGSGRHQGL